MSATTLDIQRVRELFTLRGAYMAQSGGFYDEDPYPLLHELREQAAVHRGIVHELMGIRQPLTFHGLPYADRPHFSAFTYEACSSAYRNPQLFASSPEAIDAKDGKPAVFNSMLFMGGAQHQRYRALVQPSFVPGNVQWWIRNWIEETVHLLIDGIAGNGRAELNVDFCAAIPVLTITGSFGVPIDRALDIRAALSRPAEVIEILAPIVTARRQAPQDDLISVLVQAEYTDENGIVQRLSDTEIYSFSLLLLTAGSGTTWKQMGITLTALLQRPDVLYAVRENRQLLRPAIEEAARWVPTDPMFSRWVTQDTEFHDVQLPKGSVLHMCVGSANRDPDRWENPDTYDISRPPKPSLAFGSGPHACLGMHVARAEIAIGITTLLNRLPNLRLDPDAEPPRFIGMYERGTTAIPVLFD